MIVRMTTKQQAENAEMRHANNHKGCLGACAWGFSNVKHGDHSGGKGKSARRAYLARGKKYWKMAKEKKA